MTFIVSTPCSTLHKTDAQIERPPSPFPHNMPASEIRAFEFFTKHVAHGLAGGLDADLWKFVVPQASLANPVIWNACLAISCFVEREMNHPDMSSQLQWPLLYDKYYRQALCWYNKSLAAFRSNSCRTGDTRSIALLTCVLYTSIEFQQGNVRNAEHLLENASRLLGSGEQTSDTTQTAFPSVDAAVSGLLARQPVHLMNFGYSISEAWRNVIQTPVTSSAPIISLWTARTRLYPLLITGFELIRSASSNVDNAARPADLSCTQKSLLHDLENWKADFDRFLATKEAQQRVSLDLYGYSCLVMYYSIAVIWTSTCLTTSQMIFDDYTHLFEEVVRQGEIAATALQSSTKSQKMPVFTFELGISPPLYFTVWKCRHPIIRRKAAALLKRAPRREGLFCAIASARAAEIIIELEEDPRAQDDSTESTKSLEANQSPVRMPPNEHRLLHAILHWESSTGVKSLPTLIYWRTTDPGTHCVVPLVDSDSKHGRFGD